MIFWIRPISAEETLYGRKGKEATAEGTDLFLSTQILSGMAFVAQAFMPGVGKMALKGERLTENWRH